MASSCILSPVPQTCSITGPHRPGGVWIPTYHLLLVLFLGVLLASMSIVQGCGTWQRYRGGGNQGCRGQAEGAAHKVGMVLSRGSYWWWRIIGSDVSHVTLLSEWDPQHPGAGLPRRPVVSSAWPCGTGAGPGTHRFLWLQAQWSLRFRVETRDQKCKTCLAQEADGIWGPRDHK